MKLDITDSHFIELHKKGYNTDIIVMLDWVNRNLELKHIIQGSKKIEALYKTMIRKNLISKEGNITEIGISLLDFVRKKTNKTLIKKKPKDSEFDEWWNIFPSNDKFEVKNKKFGPTRSFKTGKEDCRVMFNKMIIEKLFTAEEIISATKYDINLKIQRSYKTGENQLKFLRNSKTYLYNKDFEGFIGMGEPIEIKTKSKVGTMDI